MLRSLGERNWLNLLPKVVIAINDSPQLSLGFQTPSSVTSVADDPRIREEKEKEKAKLSQKGKDRFFPEPVNYQEQIQNMVDFEKTPHLITKGSFVYASFVDDSMTKSYDWKASFYIYLTLLFQYICNLERCPNKLHSFSIIL